MCCTNIRPETEVRRSLQFDNAQARRARALSTANFRWPRSRAVYWRKTPINHGLYYIYYNTLTHAIVVSLSFCVLSMVINLDLIGQFKFAWILYCFSYGLNDLCVIWRTSYFESVFSGWFTWILLSFRLEMAESICNKRKWSLAKAIADPVANA